MIFRLPTTLDLHTHLRPLYLEPLLAASPPPPEANQTESAPSASGLLGFWTTGLLGFQITTQVARYLVVGLDTLRLGR